MASPEEMYAAYLGRNPSSETPVLFYIMISIVLNFLMFYILPSNITALHKSYIVSLIHAFASVVAVTIFYFSTPINLKQINRIVGGGMKGTNDEKMVYSLCYSCGYFVYDILIMLLYKSVRSPTALMHHMIIGSSLFAGLYTGIGHTCHFFCLMEELSTIPLNIKTIWKSNVRMYNLFTGLFPVAFIVSRLIYGTIICFYIFRGIPIFIQMAWQVSDIFSIVVILIQGTLCFLTRVLNIYWTTLIFKKIFSMLLATPSSDSIRKHKSEQKVE